MSNNLLSGWRNIPLREIARPVRRPVPLQDEVQYRTMGVKWWGQGAYERETKYGRDIKAGKLFAVATGDLAINKIWVRHGSSGIIDEALAGCVVTQDFPTFQLDLTQVITPWLRYMFKTAWFWQECDTKSRGTSGRQRINPDEYLDIVIPLPPLAEQQRIVAKLDALRARVEQAVALQDGTEDDIRGLLLAVYSRMTQDVAVRPMAEAAPLVRRVVVIEPDAMYPELGLRSYGKGTFHKPAIRGADLGRKRIYRIEAGDVVFSNVFSWEGAVAVARPEDHGRFGSHRFISRAPVEGVITPQFLYFHFTTENGLDQLRQASPGSAGRNRTLGLGALDALQVPVPDYKQQLWFGELFAKLEDLRARQASAREELEAMMPAALDRAFRGDL